MAMKSTQLKERVREFILERYQGGALFCVSNLHHLAKESGYHQQSLQPVFYALCKEGVIVKTDQRLKSVRKWAAAYQVCGTGSHAAAPKLSPQERIDIMTISANRLAKAFGMPCHV